MFKSIRWRVHAWHAAILLLTVAGLGATLFYQLRQARLDEIDGELHAAARALEGTLRGFPPFLVGGAERPAPPPRRRHRHPRDGPPRPFPPGRLSPRERLLEGLVLPDHFGQRWGAEASPYFVVWVASGAVLKASPSAP